MAPKLACGPGKVTTPRRNPPQNSPCENIIQEVASTRTHNVVLEQTEMKKGEMPRLINHT